MIVTHTDSAESNHSLGTLGWFEILLGAKKPEELAPHLVREWSEKVVQAPNNLVRAMQSGTVKVKEADAVLRIQAALIRFRERFGGIQAPEYEGMEAFGEFLEQECARLIELKQSFLKEANREADLLETRAGHAYRAVLKELQKAAEDSGVEKLENYREIRKTLEELTLDASGRNAASAWLSRGWLTWRIGDRPKEVEQCLKTACLTAFRSGQVSSALGKSFLAEIFRSHHEFDNAIFALKDKEGVMRDTFNPLTLVQALGDINQWEEAKNRLTIPGLFEATYLLGTAGLAPLHSLAILRIIESEAELGERVAQIEVSRNAALDRMAAAEDILGDVSLIDEHALARPTEFLEADVFLLANRATISTRKAKASETHWAGRLLGLKKRQAEQIQGIDNLIESSRADQGRRVEAARAHRDRVIVDAKVKYEQGAREADRAGLTAGTAVGMTGLFVCAFLWLQGSRGSQVGGSNPFTILGWSLLVVPIIAAIWSQITAASKKVQVDKIFEHQAARAEQSFEQASADVEKWFGGQRDKLTAEKLKATERMERIDEALAVLKIAA